MSVRMLGSGLGYRKSTFMNVCVTGGMSLEVKMRLFYIIYKYWSICHLSCERQPETAKREYCSSFQTEDEVRSCTKAQLDINVKCLF